MKTYVCSVCGYLYEEAKGVPGTNVVPGTKWEDLPADWVCPWCGAGKDAFQEKTDKTVSAASRPDAPRIPETDRELSAMEMSILCSNLARGCEKQYLVQQAADFAALAETFRAKAVPEKAPAFDSLLKLIEQDLSTGYPYADTLCAEEKDRGALRALVWSEKVTRMLKSLLERYAREGEKMLQNTGVYVCTICGFVFIGNAPPELCPVCKVPSWKFEKIEGRAV